MKKMNSVSVKSALLIGVSLLVFSGSFAGQLWAAVAESPLFLSGQVPPLNLLIMGRDHKLYYEAYNDASDLDGDNTVDVGYKPNNIDYFGYFDSHLCYEYDAPNSRFEPTSATTDKTCSGTDEWSGDFLNYLTTSRLDALRKVLYGGYRSTDSADTSTGAALTVLERSHVPQNAHAWGKEYSSVANDGYDIRNYSPLALPASGTRHLFANVTLLNTTEPLLRVLNDSHYRIWEWVSIERPVAGSDCNDGSGRTNCTATASGTSIVSSSNLSGLMQRFYAANPGTVASSTDFDNAFSTYGIPANLAHTQTLTTINGSDPYGADYFISVIEGSIVITTSGTYTFYVDGDDAIDFYIDSGSDGYTLSDRVAYWYGAHGRTGGANALYSGTVYLAAGTYPIRFRHQELTGSANWYLYWDNAVPASVMTDYSVRIEVCNSSFLEDNCKSYSDGTYTFYKPTGLLQDYGEDDQMYFGLLTGSYHNNTQGGVLRKKIGSFADEVNPDTGQFTSGDIITTIDNIQTTNFGGSYQYSCGWITSGPMTNGQCSDWGNPVAEMMYEGLRYFAGKKSPTSIFSITSTDTPDATLGLPLVSTWDDPYETCEPCAKAFELVISDINPSYDSDNLPGSYFGSDPSDSISGMDVEALGDTIWNHEYGSDQQFFIGQSGTVSDGAPTAKTVSSFGNIRGLAPEEPTKQGSYYPASVAYYGLMNDLNAADDDQTVSTFTVALASPLPEIKISVAGTTVIVVPFAKSVSGSSINYSVFAPTNSIVDYYVESLTATSGTFSINFEDVEQGADHDMDAIAKYTYTVNDNGTSDVSDDTVTIDVVSTYAAGGIDQHMGYVISGTTADGVYLEVKDVGGSDIHYPLDTPAVAGDYLGLTASRTFTPSSSSSSASFLKNPLWYAAKYGLFDETVTGATENNLPDSVEYDKDGDGDPDNYFLVTNALTLSDQLSRAFDEIVGVQTSAASVATNSTRLNTDSFVYLATFNTETWAGELTAYPLNYDGTLDPADWYAGDLLTNMASPVGDRNIYTYSYDSGISAYTGKAFAWANLDAAQQLALNTDINSVNDGLGADRVAYLRGSTSLEEDNGGTFRNRNSLLGDIINSDPWYTGSQNYGYANLCTGTDCTEGNEYVTYRSTSDYLNRSEVLYVGANDGMLHAFDAGKRDTANSLYGGKELFAYVPNSVYSKLSELTSPDYDHTYFVDGPPRATDAYVDLDSDGTKEWETILVGSLGAGGKGVYALRVTDPDNFSASDVLWEITPATTGYGELGYILDQPFIVRMANGDFCAVFGNGYEGASGKAVLYVADLTDGSLVASIDVGGASNGLSGVAPIDYDGGLKDSVVDYIYAGDLQGNMWKFDVTDASASNWESAYGATTPLFIAQDDSGNVQPITARPEISIAAGTNADTDDVMVYFGTGKYYATGDNIVGSPADVQTMYGIYDDGTEFDAREYDRSDSKFALVEQTINLQATTASGAEVRALSDNAVDYSNNQDRGWYLDLVPPSNVAAGERVVERAQVYSGYLIYVTLIPSDDVCAFGGDSWTMVVDPDTGGALGYSVFDVNGDGSYDAGDQVTDSGTAFTVSSVKSDSGIISTPAVVSAGDTLHLLTTGTDPDGFNDDQIRGSGESSGRGSWRQLR